MPELYSHTLERPLRVVPCPTELRPVADRDEELFRSLFERSGVCIASLDLRHRVQEANADLLILLGRNAAEVEGREFTGLLHPDVRSRLQRQFDKLRDAKCGRFTEQVVALHRDGTRVAGKLTAVVVRGADQAPTTILVMLVANTARDSGKFVDQSKVLTDVDAKILEGVAAGASTVQMASQLYLSRQGVEYHVSAMLRKLKAPNRPALVSRAYTLGILSVGIWPPRVLQDYVRS